jgi:hypothetical protein
VANVKISQLPAGSVPVGADVIPIVQYGVTNRISIAQLFQKQVIFTQSSPAATWNIAHNLGKYPHVILLDSTTNPANLVVADIQYVDTDNIVVSFGSAQVGRAILE